VKRIEDKINTYRKIRVTEDIQIGNIKLKKGSCLFVEVYTDPKYPLDLDKERRDMLFDTYMKAYRRRNPSREAIPRLNPEQEQKYYDEFLAMGLSEIYDFIDNALGGNRL
jgi:hypothetical protein